MRGLALVALSACVSSGNVDCPNGTICPAETVCLEVVENSSEPGFHCVDPDQFTDCADKGELAACTALNGGAGTCHAGACFEDVCGNTFRDFTEVCDDGNLTSGDGCAAGCNSNEVCGNGLIDPILLEGTMSLPNEQCDDSDQAPHDGCSSDCDVEAPRWSKFDAFAPDKRTAAAMAFDTARQHFVMFGGSLGNADAPAVTFLGKIHACGTRQCLAWTPVVLPFAPAPRHGHMMVYDEARDRVLLFGGQRGVNPVPVFDMWEWNGARWTPLPIPPSVRAFAAVGYDPIHQVVVVQGGEVPGVLPTLTDDTFEWNGTEWNQLDPAPEAISRHGMAFDPVRGVLVLVGTAGGKLVTWHYDAVAHEWDDKTPLVTPPPREGGSVAWDPTTRTILLFGGEQNGTKLDDAWSWDGAAWTPRGNLPAPTGQMTAGTDAAHGVVIGFGGQAGATAVDTANLWNGTDWKIEESRVPATELRGHAATFDPVRGRTIVVTPTETWEVEGTSWILRGPSPFPVNTGVKHAAIAYDAKRGETVLFGGEMENGVVTNRTFVWNGNTWRQVDQASAPVRARAAMAFDPETGNVLLLGGHNDSGIASNELWSWNGTAWSLLTTQGTDKPGQLVGHGMAYDPVNHRMVVFGGAAALDGNGLADTWLLATDSMTWEKAAPALAPFPRFGGKLVWNNARRRIVVFGGTEQASLVDSWEWDGTAWTELAVDGPPPPIIDATLTQSAHGALFLSSSPGKDNTNVLEVFELRWESDEVEEQCEGDRDVDGDGAVGCDDSDCRATCAPLCVSQATEQTPTGLTVVCIADGATCGNNTCDPQETCHNCAADCACAPRCGDRYCDAPETVADCPGDCTP